MPSRRRARRGGGRIPREPARPEKPDGERDRADGEGAGIEAAHRRRKRPGGAHRPAGLPRSAEQRQRLHQHDDDADAGHEAGNDHMRRVGHEAADPRHAEKHLQKTGQNDDRQGFGEAGCVAGEDDRHGDGHRRRRAGNLRARAAEHGGEEADRDGAVEAGGRPHARGDAEAEGNGQRHHHGGDAAEDIAAQRVEVVVHAGALLPCGAHRANLPSRRAFGPQRPNRATVAHSYPAAGRLAICRRTPPQRCKARP